MVVGVRVRVPRLQIVGLNILKEFILGHANSYYQTVDKNIIGEKCEIVLVKIVYFSNIAIAILDFSLLLSI